MLKLLLFDLDGTLADTGRDIADALNFALKPFGGKPYSVDEVKTMVGSDITRLLRELTPSGEEPGYPDRDSVVFEEIVGRFFDYYSAHLLRHTTAYPAVKKTLSGLGSYKKAVLSNKREVFSRNILSGLGLLDYFDAVYGSDSLSAKKPSPEPVLEILRKFHVSRDESVIIGDSSFDIEAGRAAGLRTIAVTYGFRSRETLKEADYLIDSFGELLTLLPEVR
jgi:phosphoglycolate phosphatase